MLELDTKICAWINASMQEQEQARQLTKTRTLATGLLVLMAIVFVAAKISEAHYPYLSFVTAFAEAAMVGALADWFAVTALFRSPLGLPIPHTAIIPRNKERIGENLAHFLKHNFMTQEIIREELRPIDFVGAVTHWLADQENSRAAARQIARSIPAILRMIEDEDVARFMQERLSAARRHTNLASLLAEIGSLLVASGHHQALFNHLIDIMARAVEQNSSYIRWKIDENSPRWLPKAVDDKIYERLLHALLSTLDEMREEDSEWRYRFHIAVEEWIEKLRTSPEYEEKVEAALSTILEHPKFQEYVTRFWHDIKSRIVEDVASDDSRIAAKLDQALQAFCEALLQETGVRSKLNQWIRILATDAIVERRAVIADLVSRVIRKWDPETVSRKLELQVGKDLQYIRINGTLVGGFVGLILHAISRAL
jgi:uncharacterized membrane-anchored protein YjiN (DUF445 family)